MLTQRTNDEVKADPDRLWRSDAPADQAAAAPREPTYALVDLDPGGRATWDELDDPDLRPDGFTLRTMPARLAERGDEFAPVLQHDQVLPRLH